MKWRIWFAEQWHAIQKIFARDVSKGHNEKGDCDNEDS
jgi:hypothetical protein